MSVTATRADARHQQSFDLQAYLAGRTAAVDRALDRFLPEATTRPATIHKAMRYSLFAGGKRMRPALCLAAAEACGGLADDRSEEHTSELQSPCNLVCRLLLEKKKKLY